MILSHLLSRDTRHLTLRGEMTLPSGRLIHLTGSDILSLSISEGVQDGMLLGACPAASLRLSLADPEGQFLLYGGKRGASLLVGGQVRLFLMVRDDGGDWLETPLGLFDLTALQAAENSLQVVLQGTDALGTRFDIPYTCTDMAFPCTLASLAQHMGRQAGMAVNTDFPLADYVLPAAPDFDGFTLRRALSALCAVCASFAHVDRNGHLRITPVRDPLGIDPYPLEAKNALQRTYGETVAGPLRALRVHTHNAPGKAQDALKIYTDEVGVLPDQVADIAMNPLFPYGAEYVDDLARGTLSHLLGYRLERASLLWQGDPRLQLGRSVCLTDKRGAVTLTSVTRQTLRFDRGFSMQTECTLRPAYASGAGTVFTTGGMISGSMLTGSIHGNLIVDGTISATALKARTVTADYIAANAIDTVHLTAEAVTADKIKADAITAEKIKAGAVTAEKIKAGSITANAIQSKTITAEQLSAGLITADSGLIADSAIGNAQIADGSITDAKIVDLTAGKITAGTLNAADVNIINLKADNITTGTLNGKRIPVLGEDKIADGAISGVKIVNGAVTTDKIDDGAVTAAKVVASAITTDKLAANAVTANKILSGAVTADKIAANAVTADKIRAHAITANHLASDVGSSLDLSSNAAINTLVRDVEALPTTYVKYDAPGVKKVGDIWINTGGALWSGLAKGTWQDAGASQWGDYYNPMHKTRVWNGQQWEVLADQAVTIDQETRIRQTEESLKMTATRAELENESKRISQAEEKITPEAITRTVRSSTEYKQDLSKKVEQTVFDQTNNAINARIEAVDEKAGATPEKVVNTALTLDANGIDMQGGQVNLRAGSALHIEAGSAFTVDAPNFDLDENGTVSMNNASVNGELLSGGQPVLTARNLVVSSTTPKNPIVGTVWVKPMGAVVATFVYNNTSLVSFEKMESAHTLQNLGSPTTAGGTYTWNASIPYKVLSPVTAERYLRMKVNGTVLFDTPLNCNAGTYTLLESGTLASWLGNAETLTFTLELHFLQGSESYLHNVHRLNTGAVELKLTAATDAARGWMATEIQVYNG